MAKDSKTIKVYALIVAIDKYRGELFLEQGVSFPALGGCVNDANDMLAYLEADSNILLKKLVLHDQDATKPAVIDGFRIHLAQAKKNDVVFLYYSGHGAVEAADTSIWQDGYNECLVCYYDKAHAPDFLLADKELRFLLKELYDKTKAHIVTIFDCCHSGDNTREVFAGTKKVASRRVDWTFTQRKWEEFLFSNKYKATDFAGKNINDVFQQAPHVQIAAAERDEPALEVNGRGVLTSHLTKCLRAANGNLSYRDLHSRIRNQVKYLFVQKPKIYSPDGSLNLHEMGFLKKIIQRGEGRANLVYNKKWGWTVDRGVLHGVVEGKTVIEFEAQNEKWSQKAGKTELERAQVSGVVGLDKEKQYSVVLKNMAGKTLRIQLVNKDATTEEFRALNAALEPLVSQGMIAYEDKQKLADYSLVVWRGMYYVTKPGDLFRPLFRPVTAGENGDYPADSTAAPLSALAGYLQQMSEWAYLNELDNKATGLPDSSLKVEFFRVLDTGAETPIVFNSEQKATVHYDEIIGNPNKKWGGKVRIKLTNTSTPKTKIYAAVLYQTADFGSNPNLMEPMVAEIEPDGKPKIVRDHKGGFLNMSLDPNVIWYNLSVFTDTFKVVFSTEEFSALGLKRDGLPELLNPDNVERGELEGTKGTRGGISEDDEEQTLQGWNAQTFHLEFINPEYDKVPADKVKRMLDTDNDELAHFGMGLYFQTEGFNAQINAPKGVEEVAQKGIVWSTTLAVANRWSKHWRNRRYQKMLERFPTAPIFISEGDSWFQHPMLKDIIDNVGELYPIYCLAAAGDTIENYLRDDEYKDAIERQKPAGFLISGGGNDILGESLRNLLSKTFDKAPEGERPERFFNDQFQQAMTNILKYYREIFDYCKQIRPQMKIYIHGYDYVLPLKPEESKNKGWLGKFFNEVGVVSEKDRTAAVLHMMGIFNDKLAALAAEYAGQVEYIKLLDTVKPDQWSDEIHPTDEGYQEVSLKFIKRIQETVG